MTADISLLFRPCLNVSHKAIRAKRRFAMRNVIELYLEEIAAARDSVPDDVERKWVEIGPTLVKHRNSQRRGCAN